MVRKEMAKQRQAEVLEKQQEKDKAKAQAQARAHKPKGKTSHPDQINSSKKARRTARTHDTQSEGDTQDKKNLIGGEDIVPDGGEIPLGPDKIGFYAFFLEGQGYLSDLMGVDGDYLLAIQNDLRVRLKARRRLNFSNILLKYPSY